jgi:hypothetical protein
LAKVQNGTRSKNNSHFGLTEYKTWFKFDLKRRKIITSGVPNGEFDSSCCHESAGGKLFESGATVTLKQKQKKFILFSKRNNYNKTLRT